MRHWYIGSCAREVTVIEEPRGTPHFMQVKFLDDGKIKTINPLWVYSEDRIKESICKANAHYEGLDIWCLDGQFIVQLYRLLHTK